jgi:hypothetical protein
MRLWGKRSVAIAALIALQTIFFSCSSGPRPPEKGTPAFDWQLAQKRYADGDYLGTIEALERIVASENEVTARAMPWLLVMTSGMTRGYMEVADHFEGGARINKADPTSFRRQTSQNRNAAGRMALRFAEAFGSFQTRTEDPVVLDFAFPTGSAAPVAMLTKVSNGMLPPSNEIEAGLRAAMRRAVLLNTCRAVGSPDDAAKTQEIFKAGEVKLPRAEFVLAMAAAMHDTAEVYSRNKLDDPQKMEIFCTRAQEALKSVPESKERKELLAKIAATLKKIKS